jgi:hypothetical protein
MRENILFASIVLLYIVMNMCFIYICIYLYIYICGVCEIYIIIYIIYTAYSSIRCRITQGQRFPS